MFRTKLCHTHTHNLSHISTTHNFVTHNLSHTTLSHTVFHIQLCHAQSFTQNVVTGVVTHNFVTQNLSHTHTSFTHNDNFVTHTTLSQHFWHLATSTLVLRGRGGTYSTGLGLVARLVAVSRPWRSGTLRGRRGTWRHQPSFCVAGVALMALSWVWWRAWSLLVAPDAATLCVCVACVSVGDIDVPFAWQVWHWVTSTFVRDRGGTYGTRLNLVARLVAVLVARDALALRGRRGTWRHPSCFCVTDAALGDINLPFPWQAWHLWHSAGSGGALGRPWCRGTLRDRWVWWRAWSPAMPWRWQGWHLATSTLLLRGRSGAWWHQPSFCMAGVALSVLDFPIHNFFKHNSFTHIFYTQLFHTHTQVSHTQLFHNFLTQLFHTRTKLFHNFLTHNSFAHNFVTHNLSYKTLSHTTFSHTFTYKLTMSSRNK